MSIYHEDSQLTLHNGDALAVLRTMESESVNCCVTSPPYFGLRDYGVDGQIGLEPTPEKFIAKLVEVFREVRRVLKDDGTLWVNIGDSYAGSRPSPGRNDTDKTYRNENAPAKIKNNFGKQPQCATCGRFSRWIDGDWFCDHSPKNYKSKDLIGIPWMLAFALRADGWYLRSEIIWHKPNPMPESVTDRPTKAHEQIFLLSKSAQYFYDAEAVQEQGVGRETYFGSDRYSKGSGRNDAGSYNATERAFRNRRSVWSIASSPYAAAHFATYPPELIKPCILAGCPSGGVVLDPFAGSGTTAQVANKFGRRAVLIELNREYCELILKRNCQKTLFAGAEVAA